MLKEDLGVIDMEEVIRILEEYGRCRGNFITA
jgi:hypothetical protein